LHGGQKKRWNQSREIKNLRKLNKMDYLLKNKKGVSLGVAAIADLVLVLFFLIIVLGIPITGLTIFIVQNGKLLTIVVGLIIGISILQKLFRKS